MGDYARYIKEPDWDDYVPKHKVIKYIHQINDLKDQAAKAEEKLRALMEESDGVAGLHDNGDIADWDWLKDNEWI